MKYYFLVGLWIAFAANAIAQSALNGSASLLKLKKEGAILFVCNFETAKIAKLNEMGFRPRAEYEREEAVKSVNLITAALRDSFTFCPYYLVPDSSVQYILKGDLSKVVFLNDQFQPDKSIIPAEPFLMMMRWYQYRQGVLIENEIVSRQGLVFFHLNNNLPKQPFPSYVKKFFIPLFNEYNLVRRANKKLEKAYQKALGSQATSHS